MQHIMTIAAIMRANTIITVTDTIIATVFPSVCRPVHKNDRLNKKTIVLITKIHHNMQGDTQG